VVHQGCHQDAEDDGQGLAEFRGQDEGEQLGLVADFREGDDTRRDEEGFQGETPRPASER
jgi:hypothetical protein